MWKKIDQTQNDSRYLSKHDQCYYAREYIPQGSYRSSVGNDLISNFKKPINKKNTLEWNYKLKAIKQFVDELSLIFNQNQKYVISTIPTSKKEDDKDYDSRLDEVAKGLEKRYLNNIIYEKSIRLKQSILSSSKKKGSRNPEIIYKALSWNGFSNGIPFHLFVIDDVITTGGHFKTYERMILEKYSFIKVIGLFFGKTIYRKSVGENEL